MASTTPPKETVGDRGRLSRCQGRGRRAAAIASRAWGKGYASEGAQAALDWIMATHRPRRIGSNIDPRNTASARIAQKLGAVPEGTTDWAGVTLDVWAYYA
jgi:RimJ/RimL family protein N-acetyltransferase